MCSCVPLLRRERIPPDVTLVGLCALVSGTNVKEAKALIEGSGYRMIMSDDLEDAAAKAVKIADIVRQANEISIGVTFELPL